MHALDLLPHLHRCRRTVPDALSIPAPAPLPSGFRQHVRTQTLALTALLAACSGSPRRDSAMSERTDASVHDACFGLLQSPAAEWPAAVPPVLELGPRAADELARVLQEAPHAPGAPAAAAALGVIGNERCHGVLVSVMVDGPEATSAEAALALGRLRAVERRPILHEVMADPSHSPLVRTAAAAALVRIDRNSEAMGFLLDVLLAGTPGGRTRGRELGLPVDRPRWALERNLAISALSKVAGEPLDLDADAPWPRLEAAVARARHLLQLAGK